MAMHYKMAFYNGITISCCDLILKGKLRIAYLLPPINFCGSTINWLTVLDWFIVHVFSLVKLCLPFFVCQISKFIHTKSKSVFSLGGLFVVSGNVL